VKVIKGDSKSVNIQEREERKRIERKRRDGKPIIKNY
jgi:hypothetical protein